MSIEKQISNHLQSIGAVLVRSKRHNVWRLPNGRVIVTSQSPSRRHAFNHELRDIKRAEAAV
jgi:hypothetical protein